MLNEFYSKVLPTEGVYCVTGIDTSVEPPRVKNYFADTLDKVLEHLVVLNEKKHNAFVALSSFDGYSRKADNAIYSKSFFVDLDVGEDGERKYATKQEALDALAKFIESKGLPPAVRVDSGRGVHAYWPLDINVPIEDWKIYAEKFKTFCIEGGLLIDRSVTADAARVLRAPNTFNYKENPPLPTSVLDEEITEYSFDEFKQFLGDEGPEYNLEHILQQLPKGDLTPEQKQMLKTENFVNNFSTIAMRSLQGDGCAHIAEILTNPNGINYDLWTAALTIAVKCEDGDEAIHKISEDYDGYDPKATIKKAYDDGLGGPRTCDWFATQDAEKCKKCRHRGKIGTPLQLGKELKQVEDAAPIVFTTGAPPVVPKSFVLPEAMFPYIRGATGGIYYMPPPTVDKKTGLTASSEPIQLTQHDVYPINRVYSREDGEILIMRAVLPNDKDREFQFPIKYAYSAEKFKEVMASHGILFNPIGNGAQYFMNYIVKWGQYLVNTQEAEIMHPHMGWTDDKTHDSFVVGSMEIKRDGSVVNAPISPLCREVGRHLRQEGSYELWKASANKLNSESLEIHAFAMLCGFGSIFMNYTSTEGVTIGLSGKSGAAKSGAAYAAISAWGDPRGLSIATDEGATKNALAGRYTVLHNLPYLLDEVGNMDPKILSGIVSKVSTGKTKAKMQGSVNAERETADAASLIAFMTANGDLYDRLKINKANPEGEVARLIEFKFPSEPKLLLDDPKQGPIIFDPFTKNFGWAGPELVKYVYANYTDLQIREIVAKEVERFKGDFGNFGPYRYYENAMATAMMVGRFLGEADIVKLELDRIYKVVLTAMIAIRHGNGISDVNYENLLGSYINSNNGSILAIKDEKVVVEPKGPLYIRADSDKGKLYIDQGHFNKYLSSLQVSSREFLFNMKSIGVDITQKRTRMGTGWKTAMSMFNVNAYVIDSLELLEKALGDPSKDD